MAKHAAVQPPVSDSDDPEYAANFRRPTLASTAGSALEYFDFALYGLASALIFSKLFFSNLDPATGLIAGFATVGVGFVARPLGGLFFGSRGYYAALPFIGIQAGTLLAAGVFAYVGGLPEAVLLGWAWRVPFLSSIVLILIALFIRMRLKESPTFVELEKHEQIAESPMREIFSHSFGSGLRTAENGGSYMVNSLAAAYATGTVAVAGSTR